MKRGRKPKSKEHKAKIARMNEKKSYQRKSAFIKEIKSIVGCFRCPEADSIALTFHHREPSIRNHSNLAAKVTRKAIN